jgi:hypothetical protein
MLAIDRPKALSASMPNLDRFSRSRGVLFFRSHESAAWTSSFRGRFGARGSGFAVRPFFAVAAFVALFPDFLFTVFAARRRERGAGSSVHNSSVA